MIDLHGVARRVAAVQRRLAAIYRLDLPQQAHRFVISPELARSLLPGGPRSGVLVLEEAHEREPTLWLGVYLDPRDRHDAGALVEETSHWVCLAWHAAQRRPVSQLLLELQGEVDQFAVRRLWGHRDALRHFRDLRLDPRLTAADRERYVAAHRAAHRYCRGLVRRHPRRSDTEGLLRELRVFYRATAAEKLRLAS